MIWGVLNEYNNQENQVESLNLKHMSYKVQIWDFEC